MAQTGEPGRCPASEHHLEMKARLASLQVPASSQVLATCRSWLPELAQNCCWPQCGTEGQGWHWIPAMDQSWGSGWKCLVFIES